MPNFISKMTWLCLLASFVRVIAVGDVSEAAVFPRQDISNSRGLYEGLYMVLRGAGTQPLSPARTAQIEASSLLTRQFYARNSGGSYDVRYTDIVDVPIPVNADGTRDGDWFAQAESYVRTTYGIEPEDYHLNVFDVSSTTPDPGQGWSGIAVSPGNNIAVQADITSDWGQFVVDHELGHHIGAPHSGALRTLRDDNYSPYAYDHIAGTYEPYSDTGHGLLRTPLGAHTDEYGNPFDVMGNISRGHFTVHEKTTDLDWLTSSQVPDLRVTGEGSYRIYAHNELTEIVNPRLDIHGVDVGYDSNVLYGLTYSRPVEEYDAASNSFMPRSQQVTFEYRSLRDGVQIYLDDFLLDADPEGGSDRGNLERELEVGRAMRELDFGTSFYFDGGDDPDLLSLSPPAPTAPWELLPEWFEFSVAGQGADGIGSYIDLIVSVEEHAIELGRHGDLTLDGLVNRQDWDVLTQSMHTDTSALSFTERYLSGDLDNSGSIDHADFLQFRELFFAATPSVQVPEPASICMLLAAGFVWNSRRGSNKQ